MSLRKEIADSLLAFVSKQSDVKSFSVTGHVAAYMLSYVPGDTLKLPSMGCHSSFANNFHRRSHKSYATVSGLFQSLKFYNSGEYLEDMVKYAEEGFFGPNSMYKDIHHLITYLPDKKRPEMSLFFYLNDTGKDISKYERALVFNFFTH